MLKETTWYQEDEVKEGEEYLLDKETGIYYKVKQLTTKRSIT